MAPGGVCPLGGQGGQDDGKPTHVPRPNSPLSWSWPWCGGCVSPLEALGTSSTAYWRGQAAVSCGEGKHWEGRTCRHRSNVFFGGECFLWGHCLHARDVWAVCRGKLCLEGIGAVQWGAVHGGAIWGKLGPPVLSPWALGPPALSPCAKAGPTRRAPRGGNGFRARMRARAATALPAAQMQILPKHSLSHTERGERTSQGEGDGAQSRDFGSSL